MGELREPLAFTYAKVEASHYNDSLAVDPTNPDVGSSGHPGGVNAVMGDGSVRFLNASITDSIWIDMGAPPADAGYLNPSSFQIIATGKNGEAEHGPSHQGWGHWEQNLDGTIGGVSVASGDVNGGDNQPDLLVGVSGSDTFNFQSQLTTEPTAPEPYMQWKLNDAMVTSYQHSGSGGDLLMNSDLLATPGPDDGLDSPAVQKGAWIMDATYPGGTTGEAESVLEGHQCLVFFLG